MNEKALKLSIRDALGKLSGGDFSSRALNLFQTLGYNTERQNPFAEKTYACFRDSFLEGRDVFNEARARVSEWRHIDLLFQLTAEELSRGGMLLDAVRVDDTIMESYLFFAVELSGPSYARGVLAGITREINKVFPMPVMVLFRHGSHLTLSVIDRRINRKDARRDVLEKVTLIKDISMENPHRAHIEILFDLSFQELARNNTVTNFVELHNAWQKTLDTRELNKRFYQELSNWYFWAMSHVRFPDDVEKDTEIRNATSLIRLITRIVFVWFIREKALVPDSLFDRPSMERTLKGFLSDRKANTYYPAILQNLFFATLNQKMGMRRFCNEGDFTVNRTHYGVKTLYRHRELFTVSEEEAVALFADVPFLNGGLFDCLDREDRNGKVRYVDGFSRNGAKQAFVPDFLFFDAERVVDLNEVYGTSGKQYRVRGLIDILSSYKFTIAENTPIEEEIALDPELLGKVFENLLASFNPETKETARKKTGSFYTPREIVNYMVDTSISAALSGKLVSLIGMPRVEAERLLDELLLYTEGAPEMSDETRITLIHEINNLRVIDPACGSGAFPMGILHKLVHILHKLDPDNELWKRQQIEKALAIDDPELRRNYLAGVEDAFANRELDYGRKLYLIENCVFGVDIQPIAVQISKLRFFISLVIDQNPNPDKQNHGIKYLPNLETKFIAADSLIGLDHDLSGRLHEGELVALEEELKALRHRYFSAGSREEKSEYQKRDREIRKRIVDTLSRMIENRNRGYAQKIADLEKRAEYLDGAERKKLRAKIDDLRGRMTDVNAGGETARMLAGFDPYDQNGSAPFFDPEWMFGMTGGFDIVIGNPPYVQIQSFSGRPEQKRWEAQEYETYAKTGDIYCLFYERGFRLLADSGFLCYITSNKWMRAAYGKSMRSFFLENGAVRGLIDFGDSPIFENATTYTNILLWSRKRGGGGTRAWDMSRSWRTDTDLRSMLDAVSPGEALFTPESFVITDREMAYIKSRIERTGTPLKDWDINIYRGILTGLNEAFIIDQDKYDELVSEDPKSAEILKPVLRGKDIKRYRAEWAGLYLISTFPALHIDINKYPAVKKHLKSFGKALNQTGEHGCRKKTNNKWFETQDTIAYWEEFHKPKVIFGRFMDKATYTYDAMGMYHNDALYFAAPASPYLAAVLNSKINWFYLRQLCTDLANGFLQALLQYQVQIPIPRIDVARQRPFELLVDYIQTAHALRLSAEAETLEALADAMVYELYFPEEIRAAGGSVIDFAASLSPLKGGAADEKKREAIRAVCGLIAAPEGPVRVAMERQKTVREVRIIEGLDRE